MTFPGLVWSGVNRHEARKFRRGLLAPHRFVGAGESAVEIGCGADQSQMRECLWKIAKMAAVGTEFF